MAIYHCGHGGYIHHQLPHIMGHCARHAGHGPQQKSLIFFNAFEIGFHKLIHGFLIGFAKA